MNNFKKLLSLFVAFAMVFTFALPIFAEEQAGGSEQEYNITFKLSDDVQLIKASDLKVIVKGDATKTPVTRAKAGTELSLISDKEIKSKYSIYINGKILDYWNKESFDFTMPNEDVLIEFTNLTGYAENVIRARISSAKPEGWVSVTIKTDEHSRYNLYDENNKVIEAFDENVYYVNPDYKVDLVLSNMYSYGNFRLECDRFYRLTKDSYIKNERFTKDTVRQLKYEKYDGYKVILHKYAPEGQEGATITKDFEVDTTYEDVVKFLRANETPNVSGKKFVGWGTRDKDSEGEWYDMRVLDRQYDQYHFTDLDYFNNNPSLNVNPEDPYDISNERWGYNDIELSEIYTSDHIIYIGYKQELDDGNGGIKDAIGGFINASIVPDGWIAGLSEDRDYYEYDLATGKYLPEKFDKEANLIKRDYFLGYKDKPSPDGPYKPPEYEKVAFDIIGYPKYDRNDEANPKIDFSNMAIGIYHYDENDNVNNVEVVSYKDFASKGITSNYQHGQVLKAEDNGKNIRLTYKNGGKEYFLYVYGEIKSDDGFDQNSINSISIDKNPQLKYEYTGTERPKFNLDELEVTVKSPKKDGEGTALRHVSYSSFGEIGLKIKVKEGAAIDNETFVDPDFNGKNLVVYLEKDENISAETSEALTVVDKEAALKDAKAKAKEEIEKLTNLTEEEKTTANEAVENATNEGEVAKALEEAQYKDAVNKEKAEEAKQLKDKKDAAKKEIDGLQYLSEDEKAAAKDDVDKAVDLTSVDIALSVALTKDKANKDNKELEEAQKAAEKAKAEADAKAKEAEEAKKAAEDAKKAAEEAQAEADDKAKEAEEAKKAAEEARKAATEAEEKANTETDADKKTELEKAAAEAEEKAKVAEEKAKEADTAKEAADQAKTEADKKAEDAKTAADAAKEAADKAQEEVDKANANVEEKEKAFAPTVDERNQAKEEIDRLPNLSETEKNKFKEDVENATTKGEVEAVVESARAKDAENKNNAQPGNQDEPGHQPEPYEPQPYYPPSDNDYDYYYPNEGRNDYVSKPADKKAEPKKDEKKAEAKKVEEKVQPAQEVKAISVMVPSLAVELTDIPTGEVGEAISNMVARGVLKGVGGNKFAPKVTINRAMVTEVFLRISTDKSIYTALEFKDVKDDEWYNYSVKWAASKNIVKGFEDGTFKPKQKVTAQEFAVMLERMLREYKIEMPTLKAIDRTKYHSLQDWSRDSVIKILEQGLIEESDQPIAKREITRAELAKVLDMIIKFTEQQ